MLLIVNMVVIQNYMIHQIVGVVLTKYFLNHSCQIGHICLLIAVIFPHIYHVYCDYNNSHIFHVNFVLKFDKMITL